ncbi:diacylglycerol kinase family protein [Cutibacterium equinum]|uniref:Diacylglycerol kinase family protein n=1 Tax=Cutibacterium equinum TaxID=3016342 RepID=A0ABY7R1U7_9ACTN|nr:diacylglycerol kinase family protein [Cutibacterium equinum]WCC80809.1 diacylglycerol kinase family protein [Cutibacterium equinum]
MHTSQPRTVAVIHNSVKTANNPRWRTLIEDKCQEHLGVNPYFLPTTHDDFGHGLASEAVADGAELVLALGGDGTIRQVAAGLAGTGVPMGILGMGTGNLLARNLNLPHTDLGASLDAALTRPVRAIDLGYVRFDESEEMCFTVIIGMGMDADTMAGTQDRLKDKVGWLAYVAAGLHTLIQPGFQVRASVDGRKPIVTRARTVLVCNCSIMPGGVVLVPEGRIDDGTLDVLTVSPHGIVGWVAVVNHFITRHRHGHRLVRHASSRTAFVKSGSGPILAEVDGDPVGMATAMRTRVAPGALLVRA